MLIVIVMVVIIVMVSVLEEPALVTAFVFAKIKQIF